MNDPCYDLIADRVSLEDWAAFAKKLMFGFKQFPEAWQLETELRERLLLRMQWHYFNPDLIEGPANRRARSWAFMGSFLCHDFQRKFTFLRGRLQESDRERWDTAFADFESLLYLSSMTDEMQLDWLAGFDARIRYGEARRVKVIKNRGLGLTSEILGVNILMDWSEIRARYRYLLKKHHPDVGGDPATTTAIIEAFNTLEQQRLQKERQEKK